MPTRRAFLLAVPGALAACHERPSAPAPPDAHLPLAFWVWNREMPLNAGELESLDAAQVKRLFWQVGELEIVGAKMAWRERHQAPSPPPGISVTAVVRIAAGSGSLSRWDLDSLIARLDELNGAMLQFDFDCPVSALGSYATALRALREARPNWRIGITALASWPDAGEDWEQVCSAADEVCPMFYDLEADRPLHPGERPKPLLDEVAVDRWLARWKACPVSWFAGLPNFSRLSSFTSTGVRHLRSWEGDELASLRPSSLLVDESPVLQQWRSTEPGDANLVLRRPASSSLRAAMKRASRMGAAGVVFFSLPQAGRAANGWSVTHLAALSERDDDPVPSLALKIAPLGEGKCLVLGNGGSFDAIDLALEIEGSPGWLRECLPGDFASVEWLDAKDNQCDARLASKIVLPSARLPAGDILQTALIRVAPRTAPVSLRWRVVCGRQAGAWTSLIP